MDKLVMAGQLLLGLSILVLVHEFGHFIAARMFGIKVEKFFLFFDAGGVKLFSFKRGDTEYGVGWLPLGGYVKITGMIDESMDKDFVEKPAEPHEFRSKPAWQRLIVMLGGIIMNILLGILIFTFHTFHYGERYAPATELKNGIVAEKLGQEVGFRTGDVILTVNGKTPEKLPTDVINNDIILNEEVVYEVQRGNEVKKIVLPKSFGRTILNQGIDSFIAFRNSFAVDSVPADSAIGKAGLKAHDTIIAVNGKPTPYYYDFKTALLDSKNKDVDITVLRAQNGHRDTVQLHSKTNSNGQLGFFATFQTKTREYSFGESFTLGLHKAWSAVFDTFRGLWRLVKGDLPAQKSLHGLIGIATYYGGTWEWYTFWGLTGMLSMVLAFMNFLPIPALDGGHVLFLLIEMVRRKPLSYRFLEVAQMVGMVLLFLLMGFALYNDAVEYIFK